MKKLNTITGLILSFLIFISCGGNKSPLITKGKDSFFFQDPELNYGRSIEVFTYMPKDYSENSPVLFVIHGNSRTAKKYRKVWIPFADKYNALLLVPHFSRENGFPKDQHYNMGNMFVMDFRDSLISANPENEWAYSLIDPIFDYVKAKLKNKSEGYLIYGHSAGSQFVHRFLFFKPNAKVIRAVCANAGWYTFPDTSIIFPYGMKSTPFTLESLQRTFARDVTVLLGDKDTDTKHKSLRRTPEANRQGAHRLERGHNFYQYCRQLAARLGFNFNWKIEEVPGAAHSNSQMAPAAAKILFRKSP